MFVVCLMLQHMVEEIVCGGAPRATWNFTNESLIGSLKQHMRRVARRYAAAYGMKMDWLRRLVKFRQANEPTRDDDSVRLPNPVAGKWKVLTTMRPEFVSCLNDTLIQAGNGETVEDAAGASRLLELLDVALGGIRFRRGLWYRVRSSSEGKAATVVLQLAHCVVVADRSDAVDAGTVAHSAITLIGRRFVVNGVDERLRCSVLRGQERLHGGRVCCTPVSSILCQLVSAPIGAHDDDVAFLYDLY
jgi:hypothetical protein